MNKKLIQKRNSQNFNQQIDENQNFSRNEGQGGINRPIGYNAGVVQQKYNTNNNQVGPNFDMLNKNIQKIGGTVNTSPVGVNGGQQNILTQQHSPKNFFNMQNPFPPNHEQRESYQYESNTANAASKGQPKVSSQASRSQNKNINHGNNSRQNAIGQYGPVTNNVTKIKNNQINFQNIFNSPQPQIFKATGVRPTSKSGIKKINSTHQTSFKNLNALIKSPQDTQQQEIRNHQNIRNGYLLTEPNEVISEQPIKQVINYSAIFKKQVQNQGQAVVKQPLEVQGVTRMHNTNVNTSIVRDLEWSSQTTPTKKRVNQVGVNRQQQIIFEQNLNQPQIMNEKIQISDDQIIYSNDIQPKNGIFPVVQGPLKHQSQFQSTVDGQGINEEILEQQYSRNAQFMTTAAQNPQTYNSPQNVIFQTSIYRPDMFGTQQLVSNQSLVDKQKPTKKGNHYTQPQTLLSSQIPSTNKLGQTQNVTLNLTESSILKNLQTSPQFNNQDAQIRYLRAKKAQNDKLPRLNMNSPDMFPMNKPVNAQYNQNSNIIQYNQQFYQNQQENKRPVQVINSQGKIQMQTQFVEQKQARSSIITNAVPNSKKIGNRTGGVTSLSPQPNIVSPNSGKQMPNAQPNKKRMYKNIYSQMTNPNSVFYDQTSEKQNVQKIKQMHFITEADMIERNELVNPTQQFNMMKTEPSVKLLDKKNIIRKSHNVTQNEIIKQFQQSELKTLNESLNEDSIRANQRNTLENNFSQRQQIYNQVPIDLQNQLRQQAATIASNKEIYDKRNKQQAKSHNLRESFQHGQLYPDQKELIQKVTHVSHSPVREQITENSNMRGNQNKSVINQSINKPGIIKSLTNQLQQNDDPKSLKLSSQQLNQNLQRQPNNQTTKSPIQKKIETAQKPKERQSDKLKQETLSQLASHRSTASDQRSHKKQKEEKKKEIKKDKYGMMPNMRKAIEEKYEILQVIGKGSYGCVSKAKCKKTQREVALKVIQLQSKSEYEIIKLLREIQILKGLNEICDDLQADVPKDQQATFIPELYDLIVPKKDEADVVVNEGPIKFSKNRLAGTDSNDSNFIDIEKKRAEIVKLDLMNICLVIEFIDTDLDSLLKHKIDFNENHLTKLLYNTLCSLAFIHMCNVMHRDLKPANILIQQNCNVKVCDFGLSRTLPESCSNRAQIEGIAMLAGNKEHLKGEIIYKNSLYLRQEAIERHEDNDEFKKRYIQGFLLSDRDRRKLMRRNMSLHVGSRWYRAPEISLVEKQYDFSADMWSLGCIIHELLSYLTWPKSDVEFKKEFQKIRYLYQGGSCFPLSPCEKNENQEKEKKEESNDEKIHVIAKDDQNLVILKDLGLQTNGDLSFLTSNHAINYIRELEQSIHPQKRDSHYRKPIAPVQARAARYEVKLSDNYKELTFIMKNMLSLNPFFRMTAYECLFSCKVFDPVRVKQKEVVLKKLHELSFNKKKQSFNKILELVSGHSSALSPTSGHISPLKSKEEKKSGKQTVKASDNGDFKNLNKLNFNPLEVISLGLNEQSTATSKNFSGFPTSNLKKYNISNNQVDQHIELEIDSADAFDYEDLKKAKFTVEDLHLIFMDLIYHFRN